MPHEPWTSNREDAAVAQIVNRRWRNRVSNPDDVLPASIYLKGMFEHTIKKLDKWIRRRDATEVRVVVLASPTCWNTETKARLQRAVHLSGIRTHQIIGDRTLETRIVSDHDHMAALRCITKQQRPLVVHQLSEVPEAEKLIVVDVGGVTIDAVVYRFAPGNLPSKSRLGGSLLVDCHFLDFLDDWIQKNYDLRGPEQAQDLMQERAKVVSAWEKRDKLNYLPHLPGPPLEVKLLEKTLTIGRYIPSTLIPADGIRINKFLLAFREEFKGFFKDTVEIIAKVVDDLFEEEIKQTGVAPKSVVLTGGLSHCAWLFVAVDLLLKESPRNLHLQHAGVKSRWNAVAIGRRTRSGLGACQPQNPKEKRQAMRDID
ncbi:unnamed protein product [Clonostachys solani]|uniref:Uncharacterized protein n=1 Tax=Clonostachys solani TaxID=160281 RepID=A0A9P0EQR8_9HYPO|nr:unnamed protein product [Clonostachys solani]